MPYYFDAVDTPTALNDWDSIEELWQTMKNDLMSVYFETEEEALNQTHRPHKDLTDRRYFEWEYIPYRETNSEEDLLYYHDLGLEALSYTEKFIKLRLLSPKFLYYWGMLSACHGFVLSAGLAKGNDLSRKLSGVGAKEALNKDAQIQWFSHYFLRQDLAGLPRLQKEDLIGNLVFEIYKNGLLNGEKCHKSWFAKMLNLDEPKNQNPYFGQLTGAFRDKKLSVKKMQSLVTMPTDDLPPLDLKLPTP